MISFAQVMRDTTQVLTPSIRADKEVSLHIAKTFNFGSNSRARNPQKWR